MGEKGVENNSPASSEALSSSQIIKKNGFQSDSYYQDAQDPYGLDNDWSCRHKKTSIVKFWRKLLFNEYS